MERFEPIGSPCRKRGDLAFQRLLLAHQFRFLDGIIIPLNYRVKKRIQKPLKAKIDFFNLAALFGDHFFSGLGRLLLFLFNSCQHCIRPIRPQLIRFKECGDLGIQVFFADERLRAALRPVFPGATVVNVAFLDFGSDAATAAAAAKKPHEGFRRPFQSFVPRCPAPTVAHDEMHGIKQVFGNDRLMCAFMHVASITEMTVINRVGKNLRNMPPDKQLAVFGADAVFAQKFAHMVIRHVAFRIHFKSLFDVGRTLTVNDDLFGAVVIQVADGGVAGIFTAPDFFAQAALGVFGKRIHIVFAEPKIVVKHELSLWRVFKPRAGKFERFDFARIEHVDDASAVHAVAGKAVGVPRENSIRFSSL